MYRRARNHKSKLHLDDFLFELLIGARGISFLKESTFLDDQ